MDKPKLRFDHNYWIAELIAAGRKIEPHKYTAEHVGRVTRAWKFKPITKLHAIVERRRREAEQLNQTS